MILPRVEFSPGGAACGRSAGAFILAIFGALWFWLAAVNTGRGTAAWGAAVAAGALALIAGSFALDRAAKPLPEPPRDPAVGRVFLWINAAQWILGGVAVILLARAGALDWAPAAIALIVGLHFYPLAWMFRAPRQYATGTVMAAAAVVFNRHYVPVLLISGTTLWLTALWQLFAGFRLVREAGVQNPATARGL